MKKLLLTSLPVILVATALLIAEEKKHEHPAGTFPKTPSPEGARVYIISPKDGATVGKTFTVRFGLKGMGVAPATVDIPNTGHHHLLVDLEKPASLDVPLPADEKNLHFGGGQTEAEITLAPGKHTLLLVLGDKNHVPHDPPVISKMVTVTVE